MRDNNTIHIVFKDRREDKWSGNEFTDYYYDKKSFIILKDGRWVGIYNMDAIESIT